MNQEQRHSVGNAGPTASPDHGRVCRFIVLSAAAYAAIVTIACQVLLDVMPTSDGFLPTQVVPLYVAMWVHAIVAVVALFAFLMIRRRRVERPAGPRIVLLSCIMFMPVSLDLIVGIFFPPPDEKTTVLAPNPSRGWSHRPNSVGDYFGMPTRINALGLRGEDFPVAKPTGEIRVLFAGDSISLGLGLAEEDTFVRRIQPLLQAAFPGKKLRTINAGCSGYTTWQEADYLEKEGLKLSPDLVVLNFCLNDVLDVINTEGNHVRGRPWIQEYPPLNHVSGLARMASYYWDRHRAKVIREQGLWTNENVFGVPQGEHIGFETLFESSLPPRLVAAWERIFDDLGEFDRICKQAHVPWIIFSMPIRIKMPPDDGAKRITTKLHAWAESRGVPHLDVADAFSEWMKQTGRPVEGLFNDEVHPSPEGSRIIADELARFILRENVLAKTGPSHPTTQPSP